VALLQIDPLPVATPPNFWFRVIYESKPAQRSDIVAMCGTGYVSEPTAEHTWALILASLGGVTGRAKSDRRTFSVALM